MLLTREKYISIYSRLSVLRLDEVSSAENAIRRKDFTAYLEAEYHYNRINRIIRAEFSDIDEDYKKLVSSARKHATLPDWPYSENEDSYILFDEQPQIVLSNENVDVPF